MKISVSFHPYRRVVELPRGMTVLEASRSARALITSICGGRGTCGKCKVRIIEGELSPLTGREKELLSADEIRLGFRLACQARLYGPSVIELPSIGWEEQFKTSLPFELFERGIEPNVRKFYLRLPYPSIDDARPDFRRLKDALGEEGLKASLEILKNLPLSLRGADWSITAVLIGGRIAAIEAGDTRKSNYGIAFDVGTTTVACYLMDLGSGRQLAAVSAMNRQVAYGEDVMSRIDYAHAGGLEELREAAVETLNELIEEACKTAGISQWNIYEAVFVGNTCMHHLLLGIDPFWIGVSPFVPAIMGALDIPAKELGLHLNKGANAHFLPIVSGFVGSDAVADILASDIHRSEGAKLLVDIGTNAEIILSKDGRILACAAAAGPAFEGARISCGMRAAPGAIDRVEVSDGEIKVSTIGESLPLGIAGSGLISAAASLRREGILNHRGRFVKKGLSFTEEILLVKAENSGTGKEITLSERDFAELILAKAAIEAGVSILLKEMGIKAEEIEEVFIAGAFGNSIEEFDAIEIGLIPSVDRVIGIGNAAGAGAILALLSKDMRRQAEEIARKVEYIELSARPDFEEEFMRGLKLGSRCLPTD